MTNVPTGRLSHRLFLCGIVIGAAAFLLPSPSRAQSEGAGCALHVDTPDESRVAYQPRENRCEGIYIQPVAASTKLILRGFHLGAPRYDLRDDEHLVVTVVGFSPEAEGGRLVATSLRPRHFYQMDTGAVDAAGRYDWSLDVLKDRAVAVAPRDLAVQFRTEPAESVAAGTPATVWPVRVESTDAGAGPGRAVPFLILESEVELIRIIMTVRREGTVVHDNTLERRYPADYPIRIPLGVNEPGRYEVTLSSVSPSGATAKVKVVAVLAEEAFGHDDE